MDVEKEKAFLQFAMKVPNREDELFALKKINQELVQAVKSSLKYFQKKTIIEEDNIEIISHLKDAIAKAEGIEHR